MIDVLESYKKEGIFHRTESCACEIGRQEMAMKAFFTRALRGMKEFGHERIMSNIDLSMTATTNGITLIEYGQKIGILDEKWCGQCIGKFNETIVHLNELKTQVETDAPSEYFKKFDTMYSQLFGNDADSGIKNDSK